MSDRGDWNSDTLEIELGFKVTFDLYHRDDVVFCWCGLGGVCWFCAKTPESMDWSWNV